MHWFCDSGRTPFVDPNKTSARFPRFSRAVACCHFHQRIKRPRDFRHLYIGRPSSPTKHAPPLSMSPLPSPAYAALSVQRDRLLSRFGFGPDPDPARQDDVEEDLGDEAAVTRVMSLPPMTQPVPAPLASERSYVVNPVFAGKGSRMKRTPLPHGVNRSGSGGGGGGTERRTSLASMETDMSSGEDHEAGWPVDGEVRNSGTSSRHSRGSSVDMGLPNHLSSWAGYGGGGAAAWVRSGREAPPPVVVRSGGKESHRRTRSK